MRTTDIWTRSISGIGLVMHALAVLTESRRQGYGAPSSGPTPGRLEPDLTGAGLAQRAQFAGGEEESAALSASPDRIAAAFADRPIPPRPSRARRRMGAAGDPAGRL